ncbi:hypothetical protein [Planococcus beigongshangi]|uniref:hypothetical protein n=1 Tax=Planococcus beigongshangi TaxID=2782536 RepID=UPI00193B41C8|nr:hypothetical protein [Planococcus beigongshangi]
MADWLDKIKTVSKTKGDSAPESAKSAGIGCLGAIIVIATILTFLIAFGLFRSGHWVMGSSALLFAVIGTLTSALLLWPQKSNGL